MDSDSNVKTRIYKYTQENVKEYAYDLEVRETILKQCFPLK